MPTSSSTNAIAPSELILNKDGSVYHLNLLPKHVDDIVITVGDPGRVHKVSKHFDKIEFEMNKREFISHVGYYKGVKMLVMSTGMGTDNVEILMNELDALVNIDLKTRKPKEETRPLKIIRIGTSGALQPDLPLGTHLVSGYGVGLDSLMCYYPLQQTEFEDEISRSLQQHIDLPFAPYCVAGDQELIELVGEGMTKGNTITCPGFYAPQGRNLRGGLAKPDMLEKLAIFHDHDFWITNFEMETAGYYAMGRILGHQTLSTNAIVANRFQGTFAKDSNKVIDELIERVLDSLVKNN